jgi:alcohol dehydrogenase class IV
MGRIFDPALEDEPDEVAAEKSCEVLDTFMKQIGMWLSFEGLGVSEAEVAWIADRSQVLPDYKNNPRVATKDEIHTMLMSSYQRN